jgi:hypothetical protein
VKQIKFKFAVVIDGSHAGAFRRKRDAARFAAKIPGHARIIADARFGPSRFEPARTADGRVVTSRRGRKAVVGVWSDWRERQRTKAR